MKVVRTNIYAMDVSSFSCNEKPVFVDEIRWKRMQSMKIEKDKLRSLVSAYLLNQMCEELGIQDVQYEYERNGKPYIVRHETVGYNLSHSGDYVALAYNDSAEVINDFGQTHTKGTRPYEIGLDIQRIRPMKEGMKKRILHEAEQITGTLSKEEEMRYLNRIWCIKESYVKMLGVGLALDFRKIRIDFANNLVMADGQKAAYFTEDNSLPEYMMSVCSDRIFQVEIEEYEQEGK